MRAPWVHLSTCSTMYSMRPGVRCDCHPWWERLWHLARYPDRTKARLWRFYYDRLRK